MAPYRRNTQKLSETHTPVWLHANNYFPAEVAGGIVFASSMEVLYLNNACYEFTMGDVEFPWALDMPNAPEVPEIILGNRGCTLWDGLCVKTGRCHTHRSVKQYID